LALVQATIQGAMAFIQALAGSAPPANFILAGLTAVASAVQIGVIAGQKSPFHRGGLPRKAHVGMSAPDERGLTVGGQEILARNNEVSAVMTAQGTRAALEAAVAHYNSGHGGGGGGTTVLMVGMKTVERVQALGRVHPGVGQRRR
jgi:hypothetical protein